MKVYLIGSLRNEAIPHIGTILRTEGFDVFDDWYGAGKEADDAWKSYEEIRGRDYREALGGHAASTIWSFDKYHLETSDIAVLVMPAGKSGALELGWMLGRGKRGYVLFDGAPEKERWDLMWKFADGIYYNTNELIDNLRRDENENLPSRSHAGDSGVQFPGVLQGGGHATATWPRSFLPG